MTQDDALYRFRVRVFALAEETGNVRSACKAMGIHPSTFYRWRKQVHRFGLEILHPRERRSPRMPNATSPLIEQKVLGLCPGPSNRRAQRISDELRRRKWGGFKISPNGVHKMLRRHGLNTKAKRLCLVAGCAAPYEPIESAVDLDRQDGQVCQRSHPAMESEPGRSGTNLSDKASYVRAATYRHPGRAGVDYPAEGLVAENQVLLTRWRPHIDSARDLRVRAADTDRQGLDSDPSKLGAGLSDIVEPRRVGGTGHHRHCLHDHVVSLSAGLRRRRGRWRWRSFFSTPAP